MQISYELAKELKDAAFPQYGEGTYYGTYQGFEPVVDKLPQDAAYVPTLSELIEACGERFHSLVKAGGRTNGWDAAEWKEPFADEFPCVITGDTPEEAVARLWLALNKK